MKINPEQFDAVLADYDGTILDSMMHLAMNTIEMYREYGIEVDPHEFICEYIQPFSKLHSRFGIACNSQEEQEVLNQKYWKVSDKNNFRSEFFPGALEGLQRLKQKGIRLGIISAAKRNAILNRLAEEGLDGVFDPMDIVGESDRKVDAITKFYTENNIDPNRVLMIGDAPSDLDYGKQAGVRVAGFVAREYRPDVYERLVARLQKQEPDFIFSDWTLI